MKNVILATGVCLAVFVFCCPAVFGNTQGEEDTYRNITAPEVKDLMEKNDAIVIHVLSRLEYEMQHITGSINIPITKVKTTTGLPQDKNRPLVFYCMGHR
jgi:rhodanese-related sulfurtransferase